MHFWDVSGKAARTVSGKNKPQVRFPNTYFSQNPGMVFKKLSAAFVEASESSGTESSSPSDAVVTTGGVEAEESLGSRRKITTGAKNSSARPGIVAASSNLSSVMLLNAHGSTSLAAHMHALHACTKFAPELRLKLIGSLPIV